MKTMTIMTPYIYKPTGVCAREMTITLSKDVIVNISITGGCNGYSKAIPTLLQGMKVGNAIDCLKGIKCGEKPTSCPDQLAIALKEAYEHELEMERVVEEGDTPL